MSFTDTKNLYFKKPYLPKLQQGLRPSETVSALPSGYPALLLRGSTQRLRVRSFFLKSQSTWLNRQDTDTMEPSAPHLRLGEEKSGLNPDWRCRRKEKPLHAPFLCAGCCLGFANQTLPPDTNRNGFGVILPISHSMELFPGVLYDF